MVAHDLKQALKDHFGFENFRDSQESVIQSILNHESTLSILPTSAGKSLCYQLPAVLMPGITVVVSPLIALMKDQVDSLKKLKISSVALTSHLTLMEYREALNQIRNGSIRIVYVAPERLFNQDFLEAVTHVSVSVLAIDEAHCLSQWGHDFRPEYRLIPTFHRQIGSPVVLALTATASANVRQDIQRELDIKNVIIAPFNRPNLKYAVAIVHSQKEQLQQILGWLKRLDSGPVIIYATTRSKTEEWAKRLQSIVPGQVIAYHAGLSPETRQHIQNAFMQNKIQIIVSTNAFGMGIDKPNIRGVIHIGLPDSVESYVQEVGRAGRDGATAYGIVVTIFNQEVLLRYRLLDKKPDLMWLKGLLNQFVQASIGQKINLLGENENPDQVVLLLPHLHQRNLIKEPSTRDVLNIVTVKKPLSKNDVEEILNSINKHYLMKLTRFRALKTYLSSKTCRRNFLSNYFSLPKALEKPTPCCDHCHPTSFALNEQTTINKPSLTESVKKLIRPDVKDQTLQNNTQLIPPKKGGFTVATLYCDVKITGRIEKTGGPAFRILLWKGDGSLAIHESRNVSAIFYLRSVRHIENKPDRLVAVDGEDVLIVNILHMLNVQHVDLELEEVPQKLVVTLSPQENTRQTDPKDSPLTTKTSCQALLKVCPNPECVDTEGQRHNFKKGERECPRCHTIRRTCRHKAIPSTGLCGYHTRFAPHDMIQLTET